MLRFYYQNTVNRQRQQRVSVACGCRDSETMGGATSFKPCMLISSPSAPFPTLPPPSFPPFPYPHFPSLVEGSQSHLPLPSLTFPSLIPFPGEVQPPKPARESGERYKKLPQWGLGRSPSRQTIWCISGPKGAALVATVLCIS